MLTGGDTGLPAVITGNAKKSYLIEVVEHIDPEMAMPPEGEKLPDEQIQLLRRWIDQGAVWPGQMETRAAQTTEHWSFQPVANFDIFRELRTARLQCVVSVCVSVNLSQYC